MIGDFAQPLSCGLLGALVGIVLALTGAGGGVIAVPMLVTVLHWPLAEAAPTGLMAVGAAAGLGALQGLYRGQVRWRAALLMGAAAAMAAPCGVLVARRLPSEPLLWGFSALMLGLAWRQWPRAAAVNPRARLRSPPCSVDVASGRLRWSASCARALAATGFVSGTLSGLVGVGGGFVIVPALRGCSDLTMHQVQLTSLAVVALASGAGVATAHVTGQLTWIHAGPFALGAMVSMLLGRQLAVHVPPAWSHRLFAMVCVAGAIALALRLG